MNDTIKDNQKEDQISQRFLQFDLGEKCYAIHLLSVKEVIPVPQTTTVPNVPTYYVGIMNLRGQIISIIDLRKKLGIKPKEQLNDLENEAVIIVEVQNVNIGLVVDTINKVVNIKLDELAEIPEIKSQVNADCIQGIFKGKEELITLLDIQSILKNEILNNIKAS